MSITDNKYNHRHENNQYMARKQSIKKRFDKMVEDSQEMLGVAQSDIATFNHSIKWLNLYVALVESVESFAEFLALDSGDLDDDDRAMLEQLEQILGVLQ